jgi:hypothetical protein
MSEEQFTGGENIVMKFCDNPNAYRDHKNNKLFIPQTDLPLNHDKMQRRRVREIGKKVEL